MTPPAATPAPPEPSYLAVGRGVASWLGTTDHKRFAVLYLLAIAAAAVVGGLLAVLLGVEGATSGQTVVDRMTHARLFTMHGLVMGFAVAIPSIPAVIGNLIVPLQLGAGNLALPRLTRWGFALWLVGALTLLVGFAAGGADTGWDLAAPYSIESATRVMPALVGVGLLALAAALNALDLLVTIHLLRPPEMGWLDLPLSVWSIAIAAALVLVTAPVLVAGLLLLGGERTLGLGLFDPTLGGDPIGLSRLFWFCAHPALWAAAIAAVGLVAEILTAAGRRTEIPYRPLVYGCLGLGLLGLLSFAGQGRLDGAGDFTVLWSAAAALAVAVPAMVVVGNLVALARGGIELTTPVIYALGFVFFLAVELVSGLVLATPGLGDRLGATQFSTAHLHALALGAGGLGFLAALHFWWPKIFGRACPEGSARWVALAVVVACNLALLPRLVLGARGTLRRAYDYDPGAGLLHQIAAVGAVALALAILAAALLLARSVFRGPTAPADPWHAGTRAWTTPSPPPVENFARPAAPRPRHDQLARITGRWLAIAGAMLFAALLAVAWSLRDAHPEIFQYGRRYLDRRGIVLATVALGAAAIAGMWLARAAARGQRRARSVALVVAALGLLGFLGVTGTGYARRIHTDTLWGMRFDPCRAPDASPLPCLRELTASTAGGAAVVDAVPGGDPPAALSVDARRAAILRSLPPDRVPPPHAGLFFATYFATTAPLLLLCLGALFWLGLTAARTTRAEVAASRTATVLAGYLQFVTAAWLLLVGFLYLGA